MSGDPRWTPAGPDGPAFSWDYDPGRAGIERLYERGKDHQWDGRVRLDWTIAVDPEDPFGLPDAGIPIHESSTWARLDDDARRSVRRELAAWQFSQFLHGEQAGLVCAARIVEVTPELDAKQFAATQVIDEARHVEVFGRFLRDKVGSIWPIDPHLESLVGDIVRDSRWDMTYLGLQVLVEGFGTAAFGAVRDSTTNPLARSLLAYVMEDEARHVAFGQLALRDRYADLTAAERHEREVFCIEAIESMRQRFLATEVWERCGLDVDDCVRAAEQSPSQRAFRRQLFTRIVPSLQSIGLIGPTLGPYLDDLGVLGLARLDADRAARMDAIGARLAAARRADDPPAADPV